jgi:hypothetical protein
MWKSCTFFLQVWPRWRKKGWKTKISHILLESSLESVLQFNSEKIDSQFSIFTFRFSIFEFQPTAAFHQRCEWWWRTLATVVTAYYLFILASPPSSVYTYPCVHITNINCKPVRLWTVEYV